MRIRAKKKKFGKATFTWKGKNMLKRWAIQFFHNEDQIAKKVSKTVRK